MPPTISKFKVPEELVLKAHQTAHFDRVCNILDHNHCYIDISRPGLGKSIIAAAIARKYGFRLGIISTVTVLTEWTKNQEKYGLDIAFMISYQSLRSVNGKQPKHGYLRRIDNPDGSLTFEPREEFITLAQEGLLLIFDEFQHIKNDTDQYKACRALTTACLVMGGQTRFGLLSGSPMDKEEHVVNLLRLIGFIQSRELSSFDRDRFELKLLGAQELINVCRHYDPEGTEDVISTCPFDHKTVHILCFRLYVEVLQAQIASAMPSDDKDHDLKRVRNGYFTMSQQADSEYQSAISELGSAARFNPILMSVNRRHANFGAITSALMHIETSKLEIFERRARKSLLDKSKPGIQRKVILFVNFVDSILKLAEALKEFNPLVMYGATPKEVRGEIIEKFQRPTSEYRLMIINTKLGEGTNLDDRYGHLPRDVYINASYDILAIHQASDRTRRTGTKSETNIWIVYGKVGLRETSILNALARKSDVMRQILPQQVQDGIRFPGDYLDEFEDDRDVGVIAELRKDDRDVGVIAELRKDDRDVGVIATLRENTPQTCAKELQTTIDHLATTMTTLQV